MHPLTPLSIHPSELFLRAYYVHRSHDRQHSYKQETQSKLSFKGKERESSKPTFLIKWCMFFEESVHRYQTSGAGVFMNEAAFDPSIRHRWVLTRRLSYRVVGREGRGISWDGKNSVATWHVWRLSESSKDWNPLRAPTTEESCTCLGHQPRFIQGANERFHSRLNFSRWYYISTRYTIKS